MKVEFVEDGMRLVPETEEENRDLAARYQVTPPFKVSKQKVALVQLVDQYACPIANQYYLVINKDQKRVVRKKKTKKLTSGTIVVDIPSVTEEI
jgi:hypothetical protein